jgi:hypothetical protein
MAHIWQICTSLFKNGLAQKLQKIAIFLRNLRKKCSKSRKLALFAQISGKIWDIYADPHGPTSCTKIAKNCKKLAFF